MQNLNSSYLTSGDLDDNRHTLYFDENYLQLIGYDGSDNFDREATHPLGCR